MGLLDYFRSQPENEPPTPDEPFRGASGRGHTHGYLAIDEENNDLRHPHGHRLYDQMYKSDGDVRQVVQLATNPIINGTWQVQAFGGAHATPRDQAVAEFVRWALWDVMEPGFSSHLAEALPVMVRSGFAPFEVAWAAVPYDPVLNQGDSAGLGGLRVVPRTLGLRLPRTIQQFEQDKFGQLTRIRQFLPTTLNALVSDHGDSAPEPTSAANPNFVWIEARNLLYYRIGGEGDNWEGTSLLRPAYKHWLMKDRIERVDAVAQEREGLGIPIAYPPMGATTDQLDAVESVLEGMRSNEQGYIVAPGPKAGAGAPEGQGWLFDLIGYNRTGSGRDPQPSLKYHSEKIAAAFLSEFMRLGHSGGGSRATGEVQVEPFLMSVEALTNIVEDVINDSIVQPLIAYNFADVKNPPRVKMSLVDSTTLSQLADFVLKLTQVGAMIPDQQLEDFLRDRGDLPPADPTALAKRRGKDAEIRQQVITGGGEPGGGAGQHAKPGFQHGPKSVAQKASVGPSGGNNRGSAGLDADADADDTVILDAGLPLSIRHPLKPWEHGVALDAMEQCMDAMPDRMQADSGKHVYALARTMANGASGDESPKLKAALHGTLKDAYDFGGRMAHAEIMDDIRAQGSDQDYQLDSGARSRGAAHLHNRADLAHQRVILEMKQALAGHDLAHGNKGKAQAAAEKAGMAALRRSGFDHGVPAVVHGRHDMAVTLAAAGVPIVGVRYVAKLDSNTCGPCDEADDGQVRSLDDPVRIERMPPNPECASMASGFNRCRCVEKYETMPPDGTSLDASDVPNDPTKTNWVEERGGLPPFIGDIAGDLITERQFTTSHAIATAVNKARIWSAGGEHVNADTQAKAAAAYADWQAKAGG